MPEVYILIVDDMPKNLFALEKVLNNLDVIVIKASSGQEALGLTLQYDFALAILDVQMPEMDGYELANFLLGDPATCRIPIIFLTAAFTDEQHSFKGYERGAVDYIVKPFDQTIFLSKVRVFLELARYRISLEHTVEERTSALLEESNKLRLLIENTPDCIFNLDHEGNIIFINQLGANKAFIGTPVYQFFNQSNIALEKNALHKVFTENKIVEFESNMKLPWHEYSNFYNHRLVPIVRENITECIQISRDITHLKIADEARLKLVQAEANNQAKSKFLASMSHEIRTPMNAVLGYAQLMRREGSLTRQQKEYLDIIDRSGEHLLLLIDSVLDMAKIEAGQMKLTPVKTSFANILNDIERMFLLSTKKKGLKLNVNYSDDLPDWILIDANKVRQVLINLLGNALKFSDHGKIELRTGVFKRDKSKVWLYVEIEDNGCGIEAEKLSSIFNVFEQAESGAKQVGAGLGLAVSNEFAQLMVGSINVQSELSKGSIFRFEFIAELTLDEPKQEACQTVIGINLDHNEPPLVLVVEDEIDNLNMIGKMLSSVGFNIRLVTNGQDALNAISKEDLPSIIILDLKMQDMDGIEVAQHIRMQSKSHVIPILMISASPSPLNIERAINNGVNKFLCKPVREHLLFDEIKNLIHIDYIYADNEITIETDGQSHIPLNSNMLETLTLSMRLDLLKAIKSGYINTIEECVTKIESYNGSIGHKLRVITEKFDYATLIKLLESTIEQTHDPK